MITVKVQVKSQAKCQTTSGVEKQATVIGQGSTDINMAHEVLQCGIIMERRLCVQTFDSENKVLE